MEQNSRLINHLNFEALIVCLPTLLIQESNFKHKIEFQENCFATKQAPSWGRVRKRRH